MDEFLKTCGRFAAVTPPAMTLLLSKSLTSDRSPSPVADRQVHAEINGKAMAVVTVARTARTTKTADLHSLIVH